MSKHALKEVKYKFRESPGKHAGKRYDEQPGYIKPATAVSYEHPSYGKNIQRKVENDRIYEHDRDADIN